ncbi:MAG: hypothetical protein KKD18_06960, partial [Nanoarchaeota archaeon]|nr:hypothetical protein [Nanoarchaeota archaeon]
KEDDVVLCKVQKIEGTTVFLEIEGFSVAGSMVLSEVAAGRIRNLRQYVSPNRLVVCKVLKLAGGHAELSLRRVTGRERDATLEAYKKEKAFRSVLKFVGENPDKILAEIKKDYSLIDFFVDVKEDSQVLENYLGKEKAAKVLQVFSEKEGGEKAADRKIVLRSEGREGVEDVKYILNVDAEIHYLGNSKFSVKVAGKDFKEANGKMQEVMAVIEKRAKEKKAVFETEKEK